ncbi:peritrophin-55 [Drosophila biarmipes]|uniref:peritrophin-55 n=1 Tax=Drosophila biarmipes TaxID=125945 RepID=UPI0007E77680|nr:peritrophin-55 [Drosophila biarmipes]
MMKSVICVLAALVAVNGDCINLKTYEEKIDPVVCTDVIKLPNYENLATYYQCNSKNSYTVQNCAAGSYFNMAMQNCLPCASYFPSAECSSLKVNVTCVPISATPTDAPSTTAQPTTTAQSTTTAAPTSSTTTTEAPGETTTQSAPTPPTDAPATTTTSNNDDIITPSGTTQSVPQPPSPGESNVPTPVTPAPTAPVINDSPPTAPSANVGK